MKMVTRRYIVVVKADSIKAIDEALEMGLADFTIESYNVVTEDEVPIALGFEEDQLDPEIRKMRELVKGAVLDPVAKVREAINAAMATGAWEDTAHLLGFVLEGKVI